MSVNERYVQAQHELINAGFRPERFGFFVKFVRRFLWPFIRPFHFYELQKVLELQSQLETALVKYEDQTQKSCIQLTEALTGEVEKLVKEHVVLRSDMEALKNRYTLLESLGDLVAANHNQLGAQANQIEAISHRLAKLPPR